LVSIVLTGLSTMSLTPTSGGQMDDHIGIIDEFGSTGDSQCYPGDIACAGRLEMTDVIYTARRKVV